MVDGEQGGYFGVVSTYIHLNPARARLIRMGKERLARYRLDKVKAESGLAQRDDLVIMMDYFEADEGRKP